MATTLTTASGKTTLTIKLAADTEIMTLVLNNIARLLYSQGEQEQLYDDLTTAQKLLLINDYVKGKLISLHRYQVRQMAIAVSDAANTATLE